MSRSAIVSLVIYLILLLGIWFGLLPMFQNNQLLRSSAVQLNEEVRVENEKAAELDKQAEVLFQKEEEIKQVELALPAERGLASIIAIFEEASSLNGLALTSLDIFELLLEEGAKNIETDSILKTLTVSLEITGSYSAFESFLKDIEKSLPIIDISQISFDTLKTEEVQEEGGLTNPAIDFSVALETYYRTK